MEVPSDRTDAPHTVVPTGAVQVPPSLWLVNTPSSHAIAPQLLKPIQNATDNAVAGASTKVHTRATRCRPTGIIFLLLNRQRTLAAITGVFVAAVVRLSMKC